MDRDALRVLSKDELIELVLKLQRSMKTSRTSSKPPSTDQKAKRSDSKPGGAKPGQKGHFRALAEEPDEVVDHRPSLCDACGHVFGPNAAGEDIGAFDSRRSCLL
jgi:transposase